MSKNSFIDAVEVKTLIKNAMPSIVPAPVIMARPRRIVMLRNAIFIA